MLGDDKCFLDLALLVMITNVVGATKQWLLYA